MSTLTDLYSMGVARNEAMNANHPATVLKNALLAGKAGYDRAEAKDNAGIDRLEKVLKIQEMLRQQQVSQQAQMQAEFEAEKQRAEQRGQAFDATGYKPQSKFDDATIYDAVGSGPKSRQLLEFVKNSRTFNPVNMPGGASKVTIDDKGTKVEYGDDGVKFTDVVATPDTLDFWAQNLPGYNIKPGVAVKVPTSTYNKLISEMGQQKRQKTAIDNKPERGTAKDPKWDNAYKDQQIWEKRSKDSKTYGPEDMAKALEQATAIQAQLAEYSAGTREDFDYPILEYTPEEETAWYKKNKPGGFTEKKPVVGSKSTPSNEIKRVTKDGRTAIFNTTTKEFIRYE